MSDPEQSADHRLSARFLLGQSFPLAATFLMMAGAAPIVTGGISICFTDPVQEKIHLYAFALTFSIGVFLYSTSFSVRNIAIRTVTDRRALFAFAGFNIFFSVISTVLVLLLVYVDPLADFVYVSIFNASPEVAALSREGLWPYAFFGFLVSLRGMAQGCHIQNKQTYFVGFGTLLRLAAMYVFVFHYAIYQPWMTGPKLGGYTFFLGMGLEMLFNLCCLVGKPQFRVNMGAALLPLKKLCAYAFPLMLASILRTSKTPILLAIMGRCLLGEESNAGFEMINATIWISMSLLMTMQPMTVTYASSPENFKVLLRFGAVLLAVITGLIAALAFTPLKVHLFVGLMEIDNLEVRNLVFDALPWMCPIPLLMVSHTTIAGLHTRSGRTRFVGWAGILALCSIGLFQAGVELAITPGLVFAVQALCLYHLVNLTVMSLGLLKGGLRISLSPKSLSENLAH